MKTLLSTLALLLCIATVPAKADTILTFTGGVGANDGYPYSFTVNGVAQSLMCISDFTHIQNGESWSVNVYSPSTAPIGSVPGESTGVTTKDFEEAAYLYEEAVLNPSDTDFQNAAWDVMNPNNVGGGNQTGASITTVLNAAALNATAANTANVAVYIFNGKTISGQYGDEAPQIFLGTVSPAPEPSSLLLLGSGFVGLVGVIRKRVAV